MIIDCHCHLTEEKFRDDLDEVVARAMENGVEKIIVPATSIDDSIEVSVITKKFDNVYGLVGIHPENIDKIINVQGSIFKLREIIQGNQKIVGIGEIGMDFYWDSEKKTEKEQGEVFRAQLELAVDLDLPVAIHSRSARTEIRDVFESMTKLPRGQFHCFGEDEEFLKYVLEKGFCVSFGGNVTYKNKPRLTPEESSRPPSRESLSLADLAKMVPSDRLLLETDAPYLSPEPLRGTRNEPKNVKITAEFLATLRGVTLEELAGETSKNTHRLYGI